MKRFQRLKFPPGGRNVVVEMVSALFALGREQTPETVEIGLQRERKKRKGLILKFLRPGTKSIFYITLLVFMTENTVVSRSAMIQ